MRVRTPVVAGTFYAGSAARLIEQIEWCYRHELGPGTVPTVNPSGPRRILAIVAPHAGYAYSGPVAAHAYNELAIDGMAPTAVILGPNHTGLGPPVSLWIGDAWKTPLGEVSVDQELAAALPHSIIHPDDSAHLYEHSIEVQIPWLQHLWAGALPRILPIAMQAQDIEAACAVGESLADSGKDLLLIASTDFTHYEPQSAAAAKDAAMIDAITFLDERGLYAQRDLHDCTMCGYGPVAAAIVAAKMMGASSAQLLKYATSGDSTGDYSRVVGYASIAVRRKGQA